MTLVRNAKSLIGVRGIDKAYWGREKLLYIYVGYEMRRGA